MNKIFIALLVIVAFSAVTAQSPSPKPYPAFNLTAIEGDWFLVFTYSQGGTNVSTGYSCWQISFKKDGKNEDLTQNITYNGQNIVSTFQGTPTSNAAIWDFQGGQSMVFLNVDPVAGSFALIGYEEEQIAFLLSRTPSQPAAIVKAQIAFAKAEGYLMTNSETMQVNNECT
jgi:lipocalin